MKNRILHTAPLNTDIAAFLLRIMLGGLLFMYHGWMKVSTFGEMSTQFPDLIGIGGRLSLILVIFAEFLCGILVTLGFFTRLTVIPIIVNMSVAYFIAHANDSFADKELAFLFLLLSIVIFVLGSGKFSIDSLLQKKQKRKYRF
jgi:putative oxidoreductase